MAGTPGEPIPQSAEVVKLQEPVKVESPGEMLSKIQGSGDGKRDASQGQSHTPEGSVTDMFESSVGSKSEKAQQTPVEKWLDGLEPSHGDLGTGEDDYNAEMRLRESMHFLSNSFSNTENLLIATHMEKGAKDYQIDEGATDLLTADYLRLKAEKEDMKRRYIEVQERIDNDALKRDLPEFILGALSEPGMLIRESNREGAIRDEREPGLTEVELRIPEIVEAIKAGDMNCIAKVLEISRMNAVVAVRKANNELHGKDMSMSTKKLRSVVEDPRAPINSPEMNELGMILLQRERLERAEYIRERASTLEEILIKRGLAQRDAPSKSWNELLDQRKQAGTVVQSPEPVAS